MKHDHDHSVEVKLSSELQDTVDQTKDAFQNPKAMLLIGIALGVIGTRMLSRPPMQQLIVVSGDAAVVE